MSFINEFNESASNFSKNRYEFIFAVFMCVAAFLLKSNTKVIYPKILYSFLILMIVNYVLNIYLKNRAYVKFYIIILSSILNTFIIFSIINLSGQIDSYFWVLLLLPIFTVSMLGNFFYFAILSVVILTGILFLYLNQPFKELTNIAKCIIENFIIIGGGYIICKEAKTRYYLESEIMEKRKEVELLMSVSSDMSKFLENTESNEKINTLYSCLHDVKNFITIIGLSTEIMEKTENIDKDNILRIRYAIKMSSELLKYASKVFKNEDPLNDEIDINEVINESVNIIAEDLKISGIKIDISKKSDSMKIKGSKMLLIRAILNILLNSKSFLNKPDSWIKIDVSRRQDKELNIRISDNGPGFPKEIIEKIEPFKSVRDSDKGWGLGLYSTYQIIEKHKGRFNIYNDEYGAVCEIILPMKKN